MEPLTKKQRIDPSAAEKGDIRVQSVKVLDKLTETLDTLEESSDPSLAVGLLRDTSCSFLKLKSLQRMVLDKLHDTQEIIEKQRQRRDEQELKLENLKYQKALNENSIQVCQKIETSQLLKMCCDELDHPTPKSTVESESILQKFLGADPKDPEQRATIEAKLNKEINTKSVLETELKVSQHKAASLKQSLAMKRKLLQELPLKLHEMERASLPLQKFCQKSLKASKKLGSQRRTCLDLAQSLPKALYTLFYQLQSCLDTIETSGETTDPSPSLEVVNFSTTVVLNIPIPTISDASGSTSFRTKKVARIYFEYSKERDMVTAQSSAEHDMGSLIGELFPGDTAQEWTGEDENEKTNQDKRPYHWCNYLAGLHLAPGEQATSKLHISTRVVVHAMIRRVRATATLHWLLHSLSRKPQSISVHPSMKKTFSGSDSSVKLSNWTEQTGSDNIEGASSPQCSVFAATLKRKSATLLVRARVNVARYPAVPPTWEFMTSNSKESWGEEHGSLEELEKDSALYDESLASLERKINRDIDELVITTNETTYDWILSHQLAMIAKGWEEIQSST